MNSDTEAALAEIQKKFAPELWVVELDGQGGCRLRFGPVDLGAPYAQDSTWMGGHLPAQLPYADVYPVFVRGDLRRADGAPLLRPLTAGHRFMGEAAVQVSRRTNGRDPAIETPALKFMKVIDWLKCQ